MNEILKLLGTEYNMSLCYASPEDNYVVIIRDHNSNARKMNFSREDGILTEVDVLACVVKECICSLEQNSK